MILVTKMEEKELNLFDSETFSWLLDQVTYELLTFFIFFQTICCDYRLKRQFLYWMGLIQTLNLSQALMRVMKMRLKVQKIARTKKKGNSSVQRVAEKMHSPSRSTALLSV